MRMTKNRHDELFSQAFARYKKVSSLAILDLAFRSFFLLAVAGSIIALVQWVLFLSGKSAIGAYALTPVSLHMHEMIFGFGATVAVGFLLTAVQTWTGQQSLKGLTLLLLIALWLGVRASLYWGGENSALFALVLQLLWWLIVVYKFTRLVLRAANKRNYIFIPLLVALMCFNTAFIITDILHFSELTRHLARTSVLLFCLLMGVLGGRVIPFFTMRATALSAFHTPVLVSVITLISSLAGTLVFFFGYFFTLPFTPATLMILSGLLHLVRLSYWRSSATWAIPLLWSLHLSYFSMGLGLIVLGFSYPFSAITFADALHLITIAAMGLMIFSMMSRVSLGHTGRALVVHRLIPWLFIAIFIAAFIRFILSLFLYAQIAWFASSLLWVIASLIFLYVYIPILFLPKKK